MKRIINLLRFDLKSSMVDVEQIQRETGADVRYLGIPYRDNDATMYQFFQRAYPSQFPNVEFSDMEKYLESDAVLPENYYTGASQLSYQNACYITQNSACEDVERETRYLLSKIYDWLEPHTVTLIELPGIVQERETNAFEKRAAQIKYIVNQMAERYDCVAICYVHSFEQKNQIDIMKGMGLKVPCMCWKGKCDSKARTLLEQLHEDEIDYQKQMIAWINKKGFERELAQNEKEKS